MKRLLLLCTISLSIGNLTAQPLTEAEHFYFTQMMMNQQKYWNMADVDGFMSYYWGSDSLIFVSRGKLTKGWQNMRDNYEKKYPDSTAMGKYECSDLFFYKLDSKKIITTGAWKVDRNGDIQSGRFTLIWKKIKGRWVIIMDHTS